MTGEIHPTAIVDPAASIADGVTIGPFCQVGSDVSLGEGVVLHSHVVVAGRTAIGPRTEIFPFASIGHKPQDLKFKGEESRLEIGSDNQIREHVTINPGTEGGGMSTRVGNNCLLMVGAHVAHDCQVADRVILANNATLAGHVIAEENAFVGGLSAVHQFVRIGRHAMIGGMTGVEHDVVPYGLVMGERGRLAGLNLVGLRRRGFNRADIHALQQAYRLLFSDEGEMASRIERIAQEGADHATVQTLLEFLRGDSSRRLCAPRRSDDL